MLISRSALIKKGEPSLTALDKLRARRNAADEGRPLLSAATTARSGWRLEAVGKSSYERSHETKGVRAG